VTEQCESDIEKFMKLPVVRILQTDAYVLQVRCLLLWR